MTADERALRAVVQHLEDAWDAGDSAGFAPPFSGDATFIHIYEAAGEHHQHDAGLDHDDHSRVDQVVDSSWSQRLDMRKFLE